MNAKISGLVICVVAIIYLLLYNLHDCTFNASFQIVQFLGNKANRRISKRVFQENKARQIFRKNKHFLPRDTHTNTQGAAGRRPYSPTHCTNPTGMKARR